MNGALEQLPGVRLERTSASGHAKDIFYLPRYLVRIASHTWICRTSLGSNSFRMRERDVRSGGRRKNSLQKPSVGSIIS